jgi:tetratricopeptide (TPR) repeat protein
MSEGINGKIHALPRVGTTISGIYEVLKVRTGNMGIVYLCHDKKNNVPVALKTLKQEYSRDPIMRERFLQEGAVWISLGDHPNIVQAYAVQYDGLHPPAYLVLEWVAEDEGMRDASLQSYLAATGALPPDQALLFALQITRAMKHATSVLPNLVHRDLKPANVLIGRERQVKVTDFGLAQVTPEWAGKVSETTDLRVGESRFTWGAVGTPLYMAPEQWVGGTIDSRTDIYAYGCILYAMLVGQHAVLGESLAEIRSAHISGRLRELPSWLPSQVQDIVRTCVASKMSARFQNWIQVEAAVETCFRSLTGNPPDEQSVGFHDDRRSNLGYSFNALGIGYLEIERFDRALDCFVRVTQIAEQDSDQRLRLTGLVNQAGVYGRLRDTVKGRSILERSLTIARQIGDKKGEVFLLDELASNYTQQGDTLQAIHLYEKAASLAQNINDREGERRATSNLGLAYKQVGDWKQAIHLFEKSLAISRSIPDRHAEARALANLSSAYLATIPERSIEYAKRCLDIARDRTSEAPDTACEVLLTLATAYLQLGQQEESVSSYEQALSLASGINHTEQAAIASFSLAALLGRQGNKVEALKHAEYALRVFSLHREKEKVETTLRLIALIKAETRD